jgi:hypothetical protein
LRKKGIVALEFIGTTELKVDLLAVFASGSCVARWGLPTSRSLVKVEGEIIALNLVSSLFSEFLARYQFVSTLSVFSVRLFG